VNAKVAQLVEHDLAKVGVASSNLVFRSESLPPKRRDLFLKGYPLAQMVELVESPRLKSGFPSKECGFDSRSEYKKSPACVKKTGATTTPAQMVELVDTQDLKSCSR
jgi:hypothetical protein